MSQQQGSTESRTATLDPPGGEESQDKSPPASRQKRQQSAKPAPPSAPSEPPRTPRKIIQDALDTLVATGLAKIVAVQSMGEPRQSDGIPGYTPREQDEIALRLVYVIDR